VINVLTWAAGFIVVGLTLYVIWKSFSHEQEADSEHHYQHALEAWVDGDLDHAAELLHKVVHDDHESVDAFLHLGTLLRLKGEPAKAAALHQGLTARHGLSRHKKVSIGLALVDDLLALEKWEDASEVLDALIRDASKRTRYWKSRFILFHNMGNFKEAALALENAPRYCPEKDRKWFVKAYSAYQLDRAMGHAIIRQSKECRNRLKDIRKIEGTEVRRSLVEAMLAAAENDADEAMSVVSKGLLDNPHELEIFLPILQEVLLMTGQFSRSIPILERACQIENSPPSLWVTLCLLYEKLEMRDKTMALLQSKSGHEGFTPDVAAPLLRILAADAPGTDISIAWKLLSQPAGRHPWTCCSCGHERSQVGWFCANCHAFDSFGAPCVTGEED
jgi:lipopolysaccharide biosynthesis regulator YciM